MNGSLYGSYMDPFVSSCMGLIRMLYGSYVDPSRTVEKCVTVSRFIFGGSNNVHLSSDSRREGPMCNCVQIHVSRANDMRQGCIEMTF